MADMKKIKGRIAETIYPNGQGAITAESHQTLLLEMVDDINAKKADKEEVTTVAESVSMLSQEVESNYNNLTESLDALEQKVNNLPTGGGGDFDPSGTYPNLVAGDLAGRGESVPASFGFRASGGKSIKDGRAYIKRIKGNSVVWNNYFNIEKISVNGGTMSRDGNKIVVTATGEYPRIVGYTATLGTLPKGHVVLITFNADKELRINFPSSAILGQGYANGYEWQLFVVDEYDYFTIYHNTESYTVGNIRITDLTKMFQAGNEPTTIEDFNARVATLGIDLNAYNEGEVIHCNTESIKSVGDNAWDEQWRQGYYENGEFIAYEAFVANENLLQVIPNETYYYSAPEGVTMSICYYDNEETYIGEGSVLSNTTFTIPANVSYINFRFGSNYGNTYNHDILISLYHSGWKAEKDDQYQPYWQDILPLPIIKKYFPDGMKLAGSAHDEIRYNKASGKWEYTKSKTGGGRIKGVRLADLTWTFLQSLGYFYSNDIADIRVHSTSELFIICNVYEATAWRFFVENYQGNKLPMIAPYTIANTTTRVNICDTTLADVESLKAHLEETDAMLYYESNDWEWVELDAEDQNFRDYYNVADFGTEQSQSNVPSAAFSADIIYQFNAVDMIREHEAEINELQSIIATMQAQLTSLTHNT